MIRDETVGLKRQNEVAQGDKRACVLRNTQWRLMNFDIAC
jgi:hypothetical protein